MLPVDEALWNLQFYGMGRLFIHRLFNNTVKKLQIVTAVESVVSIIMKDEFGRKWRRIS